jgi:hypothetical protein
MLPDLAPSFLGFPTEIRLQIYSYCFGFEETALPRWGHGQPPRCAALLRTCRQVYAEARAILYNQTTIVINGKGIHPSPTTIDRHIGGAEGRLWLRHLVIVEPRAMPYRYAPGVFSKRRRIADWNFSILRHFPSVRMITLTDPGPIPIRLSADDKCEKSLFALETFLCLQLAQALGALDVCDLRPEVAVFASARITFVNSEGKSGPGYSNSVVVHQRQCKWALRSPQIGCAGEVVAKVRLHPASNMRALEESDATIAQLILSRHIHADDWFPVRCVY